MEMAFRPYSVFTQVFWAYMLFRTVGLANDLKENGSKAHLCGVFSVINHSSVILNFNLDNYCIDYNKTMYN